MDYTIEKASSKHIGELLESQAISVPHGGNLFTKSTTMYISPSFFISPSMIQKSIELHQSIIITDEKGFMAGYVIGISFSFLKDCKRGDILKSMFAFHYNEYPLYLAVGLIDFHHKGKTLRTMLGYIEEIATLNRYHSLLLETGIDQGPQRILTGIGFKKIGKNEFGNQVNFLFRKQLKAA